MKTKSSTRRSASRSVEDIRDDIYWTRQALKHLGGEDLDGFPAQLENLKKELKEATR